MQCLLCAGAIRHANHASGRGGDGGCGSVATPACRPCWHPTAGSLPHCLSSRCELSFTAHKRSPWLLACNAWAGTLALLACVSGPRSLVTLCTGCLAFSH